MGALRDGDRHDGPAESVTEEAFVLVAEGVRVIRTSRLIEVEKETPGGELVGLTPDLGLVEKSAFVVELGEGDGCDDEVYRMDGV